MSPVIWKHEKSHEGHPWNEHADVLCGAAANGRLCTDELQSPVSQWIHVDVSLAEWAFLHRPTWQQMLTYPVMMSDLEAFLVVGRSSYATHGVPAEKIGALFDDFVEGGDEVVLGEPKILQTATIGLFQFNAQTFQILGQA